MKLKNVKFELVELSEGSIKDIKKRLPYQLGFMNDSVLDLRGEFFFKPETESKVYVLARTKSIEGRGEYTQEEIKLLSRILKLSVTKLSNPRFSEFLVRALNDEIGTAAFYDQTRKDKLLDRLERLISGESIYLPGRKLRPSQYDRQKYSIYQLLQDLVSDKALIYIDPEYLDTRYTKISASKSLDSGHGFWGSILSVRGNQERANLNLLVKDPSSGDYSSFCIIKDGAPWLTEMIVKVNSSRLRARLYGAGLIEDKFLGEKEFYLNLSSIPVIGKRYLRGITEETYLRACFNVLVQDMALKRAREIAPIKPGTTAKESRAIERKPGEGEYIAQGIGFDLPRATAKAKIWVAREIHDFDLELRKNEYEKAKKEKSDITFRYLMSKREEWDTGKEVEGYLMHIKKKDIKVKL